jgi:FG-GAP-like repeat
MSHFQRALLLLTCGVACAATAHSQAYTSKPAQIPATGSLTENVDFGDIDHDGDWDAVIADGGDTTQDQNRVYVNLGGLQAGTVGFFQDQTATRMPTFNTDGRDIEFVDLDDDGDLDLYTSNTSQLLNQTNRWWINNGAAQGGSLGFWSDDTAARWVGLASAGSSIPASAVLGGGGFVDWSCDCDFGDLDNDGDMDLAHGTYGGAFGGNVPTRLFLNNGAGFYTEFNPSGFQLSVTNIANGNPGLWCEGTQSANTTNSTGTNCDIASSSLDIDLIDADGDLDLDLLHGARQEAPRYFRNRLTETGSLAFRDVTGTALPAGYWSGSDNYEQEQGDMDNDNDWDLYGLNWPGLSDAVFNNTSTTGTIAYGSMQTLASSGNDDNEGDFVDYDNDGDLDLIIAAFQSTNRLYQNTYSGGAPGSFAYTLIATASSGMTSSRALDVDVADVDNDSDSDAMTAEDGGLNELLYINNTSANDTFAPRVVNLETIGNSSAGAGWHVVRVHVNDNSSYYTQWYAPT